MLKFRIRPRKWIAQLKADLQRRMQIVLFTCFFSAELVASIALFHISPQNAICVWYPSAWQYTLGHFVSTVVVLLAITLLWWFMGNAAYWESICRTRQRVRTLYHGALAGLAIDLASSVISRYISSSFDSSGGSIAPWLLLRAAVWTVTYSAVGIIFLRVLKLDVKSRRSGTHHTASGSRSSR